MGWTGSLLRQVGGVTGLAAQALVRMFTRPLDVRETVRQFDRIGVGSLNLTNITALFTGMVLALQTAYALGKFGARLYIGEVVALSLVRELGPVLTALMVGGRVGAGIAAELGSMAVTEQVDAIRSTRRGPGAQAGGPAGLGHDRRCCRCSPSWPTSGRRRRDG